ncbi:hypothetical protein ABZ894_21625 [Nocardia beijingensis]
MTDATGGNEKVGDAGFRTEFIVFYLFGTETGDTAGEPRQVS